MPLLTITRICRNSPATERLLRRILANQEIIMADTQQSLTDLAAINASLDGIVADIAVLVDAQANGTPQEVADAIASLKARAATIDAQR